MDPSAKESQEPGREAKPAGMSSALGSSEGRKEKIRWREIDLFWNPLFYY